MNKNFSFLTKLALAAVIAVSALSTSLVADHHEGGDELDLHKIMKEGHKGKTSLSAKAKKGEATEALSLIHI